MRDRIHGVRGLVILAFVLLGLPPAVSEAGTVVHIQIDSLIHTVVADFVADSIEEAERVEAAAIVIELSTPGGLIVAMDEIVGDILGSDVPVIVYVSPSGARAASAGFFILMAADVAAMAPSTHTGAAAAVAGDGSDIEGKMGEKMEQDGLATIRSLAGRNGRNIELAEEAVRDARSYTSEEALEGNLIDLIAPDVETLLAEIDGREVRSGSTKPMTLATADATLAPREYTGIERFLGAIAHPNVAYILMTLGTLGLFFELKSPGAIFPGVVGAICLILAFYSFSVLPVNYAGIALLLLAVVFFIAEMQVASFGLLTVAGLVSLVIGSLMLFKDEDPAIRVSLDVIGSVVVFVGVVVGFLTVMVVRAHRQQVRTGAEGLIAERGVARTDLDPSGKVFVHGEIWDADSEGDIESGQPVTVVAVDGLRLKVRELGPRVSGSGETPIVG